MSRHFKKKKQSYRLHAKYFANIPMTVLKGKSTLSKYFVNTIAMQYLSNYFPFRFGHGSGISLTTFNLMRNF